MAFPSNIAGTCHFPVNSNQEGMLYAMFIWHIRSATYIIFSLYLPLWNFIDVLITFSKFCKHTKGTERSASYSDLYGVSRWKHWLSSLMHKITSTNTNERSSYGLFKYALNGSCYTILDGRIDELDGTSRVRYWRGQLRNTARNFSRGNSSMDQHLNIKLEQNLLDHNIQSKHC